MRKLILSMLTMVMAMVAFGQSVKYRIRDSKDSIEIKQRIDLVHKDFFQQDHVILKRWSKNESTVDFVARMEGFRGFPYRCSAGKETIGYGCTNKDTIEKYRNSGIPERVAKNILAETLRSTRVYLAKSFKEYGWYELPESIRDAIASMSYNAGRYWITLNESRLNTYRSLMQGKNYIDLITKINASIDAHPGLAKRRIMEQDHALTMLATQDAHKNALAYIYGDIFKWSD